MKFNTSLILAFFLSAVILTLNAYQLTIFNEEQIDPTSGLRDKIMMEKLAARSLLEPSRYQLGIASIIASKRATRAIDSVLEATSCVQAYWLRENEQSPLPFVDINSNEELIPASTNKLITSAVVLSTFQPTAVLKTELIANKVSPSISNAYIRTSGDPSFVSSLTPPNRRPVHFSPSNVHTFDSFADETYKSGVRSISSISIDDSWFQLDTVEPGWKKDRTEVGLLSGFNIDEGFDGNELAPSPRERAAAVLRAIFANMGISIGSISFGKIPEKIQENGVVISSTSSDPIETLVSDMLKTSNNVYAEQLLAAAVHESMGTVTVQSRKEFVEKTIKSFHLNSMRYIFVNGSGYSRDVRSTCEFQNQIVSYMKKTKKIDLTRLSSVAGVDGTLADRFHDLDASIYAKTGTLDDVTSLTGTIDSSILFSFIANGSFSMEQGKLYQNRIVKQLSRYPDLTPLVFPPGVLAAE